MRSYIIYRIDPDPAARYPFMVVSHPRCDGGYEGTDPVDVLTAAVEADDDEVEPLFPPGIYLVAADVVDREDVKRGSPGSVRVFHDGALLRVQEKRVVVQLVIRMVPAAPSDDLSDDRYH